MHAMHAGTMESMVPGPSRYLSRIIECQAAPGAITLPREKPIRCRGKSDRISTIRKGVMRNTVCPRIADVTTGPTRVSRCELGVRDAPRGRRALVVDSGSVAPAAIQEGSGQGCRGTRND